MSIEFSVLRVAIKHTSVSASLLAFVAPANLQTYASLSTKDVETSRRINCYCSAFDSLRGIFTELSSNVVAKKAIGSASSGFRVYRFCAKKAELMDRDFETLRGWANASTFPKEVLTHLNAPFTFLTESFLEHFCFVQIPFLVRTPSVRKKYGRSGTLS